MVAVAAVTGVVAVDAICGGHNADGRGCGGHGRGGRGRENDGHTDVGSTSAVDCRVECAANDERVALDITRGSSCCLRVQLVTRRRDGLGRDILLGDSPSKEPFYFMF